MILLIGFRASVVVLGFKVCKGVLCKGSGFRPLSLELIRLG